MASKLNYFEIMNEKLCHWKWQLMPLNSDNLKFRSKHGYVNILQVVVLENGHLEATKCVHNFKSCAGNFFSCLMLSTEDGTRESLLCLSVTQK